MATTGEKNADLCQCGGTLTEHVQQLVVDLNAPDEPLKGRAFVTRLMPTCMRCRQWQLTPDLSEKVFVEARAQLVVQATRLARARIREASRRAIEEVSRQRQDWDSESLRTEQDEARRREEQERARVREETEQLSELDQAIVARARALGRTGAPRSLRPVNEISVKPTPRLESRCVARQGYSALAFQEEGAFIRLRTRT